MPKIVDRELQRKAIRDGARSAFARRGVEAAELVHVARAAGISRASIYHYYTDKAALVRDLVRDLLAEEENLFSEAVHHEKGSPLAQIENLACGLTDLYADWASLGKMLLDLWASSASMFKPFFRRIRSDLARLIAEEQRSGEIDRTLDSAEAATAVIALVDGVLLQMIVDRAAFEDMEATRRLMSTENFESS